MVFVSANSNSLCALCLVDMELCGSHTHKSVESSRIRCATTPVSEPFSASLHVGVISMNSKALPHTLPTLELKSACKSAEVGPTYSILTVLWGVPHTHTHTTVSTRTLIKRAPLESM